MKLDKILLTLCVAAGLGYAKSECDDKVFSSLSASKGTTVASMIDQLSSKCSFSVVIKDDGNGKDDSHRNTTEEMLQKRLNTVNLKDFTLKEILDFLLTENKLNYEYKNGILKIGYYVTKTFKVDYVATTRTGSANSKIGNSDGGSNASQGAGSTQDQQIIKMSGGTSIESVDEFKFWDNIIHELDAIINMTPYGLQESETQTNKKEESAKKPYLSYNNELSRANIVVNKLAGLITITGSKEQIEKAATYLDKTTERLHRQVLIDVQILSVSLNKDSKTGIDWSQIYSLQNVNLNFGSGAMRGVDTWTANEGVSAKIPSITPLTSGRSWDYIRFDKNIEINDLIKFLQSQGDVKSISNPKVLTLNNQPAFISSGDQIFFTKQGTVISGGNNSVTTANNIIDSVFSGVALDITPEILDDDEVILKINPTISNCISSLQCQATTSTSPVIRNQPPDLTKRQISSVIKAKNKDKIVLGGLIRNETADNTTKVPLLGELPLLGYLFKQEAKNSAISELVVVITPMLVKKEKNISLKDLGYANVSKE